MIWRQEILPLRVMITLDQSNPVYNNVPAFYEFGGHIRNHSTEDEITGPAECSPGLSQSAESYWLNMDLIAGKETIMKVEINNLYLDKETSTKN